jgi:hypothetical protein
LWKTRNTHYTMSDTRRLGRTVPEGEVHRQFLAGKIGPTSKPMPEPDRAWEREQQYLNEKKAEKQAIVAGNDALMSLVTHGTPTVSFDSKTFVRVYCGSDVSLYARGNGGFLEVIPVPSVAQKEHRIPVSPYEPHEHEEEYHEKQKNDEFVQKHCSVYEVPIGSTVEEVMDRLAHKVPDIL